MAWYAIRTVPGAQQPHREWWRETEDDDGLPVRSRWRSSLNPIQSLVECDLERAGFVHYMPCEHVVVRNRRKTHLYESRRFAMLKGYAFVETTPERWLKLDSLKTVHEIVANHGEPLSIAIEDIHRLRMIEAYSKQAAEAHAERMSARQTTIEKNQRKAAIKSARKKLFPSKRVKLLWGEHVGREATVEGWKDDGFVRVMIDKLDATIEAATVPYEFLRAAE